jgi:hypothetical protein
MRANDSFIHRIVPGEGIEDQSADTLPHGVRLALHSRGSARILGSFGRAHTLRPARDARRFRPRGARPGQLHGNGKGA